MLTCNVCGSESLSVKDLVCHLNLHSQTFSGLYRCSVCDYTQVSLQAFKKHLVRHHNQQRKPNNKCSCKICFLEIGNEEVNSHYANHLNEGDQDEISCPYETCGLKFSNKNTFKSHCIRKHKDQCIELIENLNQTVDSPCTPDVESSPLQCTQSVGSLDCDKFVRAVAVFYLKLEVDLLIPSSSIQVIAENIRKLSDKSVEMKIEKLEKILDENSVESNVARQILACVREDVLLGSVSDGGLLSSTYLRTTYYAKHFSYVEPVTIRLGKNSLNKNSFYVYVPIKETLRALLSTEVYEGFHADCEPDPDTYVDICSGEVYKRNNEGKKCINLLVYCDEFEVSNPIGSSRRKHKILAFYYTLCEIPQSERQISAKMQLILMVKSLDAKEFDMKLYLGKFIQDLKDLELNGLALNGETRTVVLHSIVADSLGANWVGGFVCNFSTSENFCRFCLISKSDIQHNFNCTEWRTVMNYDEAAEVEGVKDGVKFASLFNELQTFHVCGPGLPPCIAHDLLEGVVGYDVHLFLSYFVKEGWFTWENINRKFQTFRFRAEDSSVRPNMLSAEKKTLGGTASQNWTLLRFFPLLMQNFISSTSNPVWRLFILLQVISQYVFAHKLSIAQILYLHRSIIEYLEMRKILFPEVPLRPKHHFLSHYPYLITKFGPLIHSWTLKFEKKHQYFKRVMRRCTNFINILKMLSEKHQMYQAYLAYMENVTKLNLVQSGVAIHIELYSQPIKDAILAFERECNVKIIQCHDNVVRSNTTYNCGMVLVIDHDQYISFGEIKMILTCAGDENKVVFLFKKYVSDYDEAFNIYSLSQTMIYVCIEYLKLPSHYPLHLYNFCGNDAVIIKYQPLESN